MDFKIIRRMTLHSMLILCLHATPEDEEEYIKVYGTDRMDSGVWELISQFPKGDAELIQLARGAHRQAGMGDKKIYFAVKESRWLDFYDPDKYGFIKIDVLVYSVQGHVQNGTKVPYFYYITKGLRPDCVYYLTTKDDKAITLTIEKHVCGISMPSP